MERCRVDFYEMLGRVHIALRHATRHEGGYIVSALVGRGDEARSYLTTVPPVLEDSLQ